MLSAEYQPLESHAGHGIDDPYPIIYRGIGETRIPWRIIAANSLVAISLAACGGSAFSSSNTASPEQAEPVATNTSEIALNPTYEAAYARYNDIIQQTGILLPDGRRIPYISFSEEEFASLAKFLQNTPLISLLENTTPHPLPPEFSTPIDITNNNAVNDRFNAILTRDGGEGRKLTVYNHTILMRRKPGALIDLTDASVKGFLDWIRASPTFQPYTVSEDIPITQHIVFTFYGQNPLDPPTIGSITLLGTAENEVLALTDINISGEVALGTSLQKAVAVELAQAQLRGDIDSDKREALANSAGRAVEVILGR